MAPPRTLPATVFRRIDIRLLALAAGLVVAAVAALLPSGSPAAQPAGPSPLAADIDGDGVADSLVVDIGFDAAAPRVGRITAVSGATGQTLYAIDGTAANDRFGHSVRIAAIQGNGPMELLVAAPGAAVGPAGGLGRIDVFAATGGAWLRSISAPAGARISTAFDLIADQDGDGWREVIVEGAIEGNPWQARTFVFSGRTGALLATRAATLGGLRRHAEAGGRVYVAADLDDNGVVDAQDISRIASALATGGDAEFDVNRDGVLDTADLAAVVEALLRGDRSIVASGLVTEVQGEAAEMQTRWSEVHGGDELRLAWSFVTHAAGAEGEKYGGTQAANSTGGVGGGTQPGLRPCDCVSVGSGTPPADSGCSANIGGCPPRSVPVGTVVVLHPPGPGCTFTFTGGSALPADPDHSWVLTATMPGCTTVRMECSDGTCCACQECVICVYPADGEPPCEVAVGFDVCPDCTEPADPDHPELGPRRIPIDRLGSLVVGAVGVPDGGVYDWSLQLEDGCDPCPGVCDPYFSYTTPTGGLQISEHPSFPQLSPADGQVLWIHVRYRLGECDPDCCHAIALCRVMLYERDCTKDSDHDTFCDCDEDALGTDPNDPSSRPAARLIDLDRDGISRLDDVRGPTEYSSQWPWSPRPYVERFDTDGDGVQDLAELDLGLHPERTHTVSGVNDRRSPLNLLADRDQDLVYDVYELRLGLDPTVRDTDGDGIVDGIELRAGTDPLVSHRHESPDSDGDGLSDYEEVVIYGTSPSRRDTDDDGLDDFFEVRAGLNPRSAYSQGRTVWVVPFGGGPPVPTWVPGPHDALGDTDADGLSNLLEQIYGTDPTLWDSDGDGVGDGDEFNQGSNPADPSDGGVPPPPGEICRFRLTVGDHSGSHSERWQITVGEIRWPSWNAGQVVSQVFPLRRGTSYPITIQHLGSILSPPDYDYTARVQLAGDCPCWSIDDPHTPPLLGVHGESSPNYAAGKTAWLHLPMVDLDIDSDNNNGFGLPDRSRDEDSMEDNPSHPGKVILANTWDEDGDGLPGFADGFDYFGGIAAFDDTSAGTIFVPVILSFSGVPNLEEATISLDYPASDPALMSSLPHDAIALPPGKLRLWRTDGSSLRNRQPISEGGDFVTPGTYTPAQLGITNTTSTVTLYAEAVAASQTVGDIRISATYSLGSGEQQCSLEQRSDAVRFTASKVDLFARGWNETAFVPAGGLIGTSVPHPQWPALTEGVLPGPYLTYRIRVLDPRPLTGEALFLDGQSLPLLSNGTWYETPEFVCLPIAPPSEGDLPPYPDIRLNGSGVVAEYNPSWVIWCEAEFFAPPTPAAEIANTVADVVKEMETAGWNGQGYLQTMPVPSAKRFTGGWRCTLPISHNG